MEYPRACPKCNSTMVNDLFDREKKRLVSRCLNCLFKGEELFPKIPLEIIQARVDLKRKNNE